jgi:aspartate/methionine/tyrosine aminotransferase
MLTNPHNPTGALIPPEVLESVGEIAERVGARVLVDEVYLDSVHGETPTPAARISPTFISTASLTKAYGLSGLRAGWALAASDTIAGIRRVRDLVDGVGPFPTELLAHLAFQHLPELRERARGILEPNLGILREFIESRPELEWIPPRGGSVGFPRIRGLNDVWDFTKVLRRTYDTGVVPGRFFEAPGHFRIALGGQRSVLEEGLARLGQALGTEVDSG